MVSLRRYTAVFFVEVQICLQTPVNAEEAKLDLLYMGTCSTKPRIGVKQLWRYTTALREMGALKVTHSSFWDYSTKVELQLLLFYTKACSTVTFCSSSLLSL
uniref:Secreted protein n=1 Tax=Parascaris equorum TaxID=6256 RepID=A0A914RQ16_PAREQ